MKTRKYLEELNAKSVAELQKDLVTAKKELFNLKFRNATNQQEDTSKITRTRKNIARIQTIMTKKSRELA